MALAAAAGVAVHAVAPVLPLPARLTMSLGGGDGAAHRLDLAHALIVGVGDVEVAAAVERNALGQAERGLGGRATIAHGIRLGGTNRQVEIACNGRNVAGGRGSDHADDIVAAIGDVEVSGSVERDAAGLAEHGLCSRAAVANGVGFGATGDVVEVARHGGDDAVGDADHADDVIAAVGDVEIAGAVEGHRCGTAHGGVDAGPPSPLNVGLPLPAMVTMMPAPVQPVPVPGMVALVWLAHTIRMRLWPVSAM